MESKRQKRLSGKLALVTGGSRGLGRWIAVTLAQHGADVAINDIKDADETIALIEKEKGRAIYFRADITQKYEVGRLIREIEKTFNQSIDIVVNNATCPQPELSLENNSWKSYLNQLYFAVKAPFYLTKAVLPSMKMKANGSIINIGSEVVQLGNSENSDYVAAKSAIMGLTRSWASELGPYGIRVNLVAPGWIPVERHKGIDTEAYRTNIPLQRMGRPADIANAVAFLASEESSFITGQCLPVNGGNTYGL